MKRKKETNKYGVKAGDIVEVYFPHYHNEEDRGPFVVTLTTVKARPGSCNNGMTKIGHLISFTVNGTEKYCNESFITKVVSRAKSVPGLKPNMYRGQRAFCRHSRTVLTGDLVSTTEYILSLLNVTITTPIDTSKLFNEFYRQSLGLTRVNTYRGHKTFVFNRKVFTKWVEKNYTKLLKTSSQVNAEATASNKAMDEQYWASVREELLSDSMC